MIYLVQIEKKHFAAVTSFNKNGPAQVGAISKAQKRLQNVKVW